MAHKPRKRGRPPYTRAQRIEHYAHRPLLLAIEVRHVQAEFRVIGVRASRTRALEQVARAHHMSVATLRNLLKLGLKKAPADVRAMLEHELPDVRETYQLYEEQAPRYARHYGTLAADHARNIKPSARRRRGRRRGR